MAETGSEARRTEACPPQAGEARRTTWARWAPLVYALFFLSGLTSLIYEVIWVRQFGLVFGVTTYAVSTVLAAFFSGLALGSYFAGRIIDRGKLHPLFVYGCMEGVVGVYALLLPMILKAVEALYPTVYTSLGENFSLFTLFRFLASFAVLVIPTTLMGATLPVLSKLMVDRESDLGLSVGRLYAINTFGAVAGSLSAGYFLIAQYGVPSTLFIAAVGNFLLCACAVGMSVSPAFRGFAPAVAEETERVPLTSRDKLILALAFSSGLAILALEVAWTRSLVLILGSTTYAFATMLTAVLVGIALGSALFSRAADHVRNPSVAVALLLFTGGLCAAAGPLIVNQLPWVFVKFTDWTGNVFGLLIAVQFLVCFMLVFLPTFLSGASFPILVRLHSQGVERVGRTVADVYAVNTLGGIIGSLLGGFVLVKFFGLASSLVVSALFLMAVGGPLAILLATGWSRAARGAIVTLMLVGVVLVGVHHPRFDTKLIFGGWGPFAGGYSMGHDLGSTIDLADRNMQKMMYHREGVSASVDVLESGYGMQLISINAQPVATTYMPDMLALQMLGHLPVLLHPDPKQVLIIGLGAGVSSGIIGTYPGVDQVTVVELNDEVPGGTALFKQWNFDVVHNQKVKIIINDGANYVKATRKKYDFISSDPIHPFIAGNGTLYSQDHWRICRDRLNEGGVIAQWIPLYQLSPTDWATIVHTFTSVFPNASMWYSGIDVVLIGWKGDVKVDLDRMAEKMSNPLIARDLLRMGARSVGDVMGWYMAGPAELQEMGAEAPINTVDRPVLEYTAPKALSLSGVSATMPALLTAYQRVVSTGARQQLDAMSTRPLTSQEQREAESMQQAAQWVMRARLLDSNGSTDQFREAMERAHVIRPQDQAISEGLAEAQAAVAYNTMSDGDLQSATQLYQQAFANDPTNVSAITGVVQCAIEAGDYQAAQLTLDLVPASRQSNFLVRVYRGLLALTEHDYKSARHWYEEAASGGQESSEMHIGLGIVELKAGHREVARAHFDRALQVATGFLTQSYGIVYGCVAHGLQADAKSYAVDLVSAATGVIGSDPTVPLYYQYRALGYTVLGNQALAQRDVETAQSLMGWWTNPVPQGFPTPPGT